MSQEKTESQLDFKSRTCDPCKFENNETKAEGFCRTCREYLCKKCEQFHRKFQATRGHKIVHGVLMPKPVKTTMTSCEFHENNAVQYFCKEHHDVICADCKDLKHKICPSVVSLEFYQSTEIEEQKFTKVARKLNKIIDDFKNVLELRKQDKDDIDSQRDKCQKTIWELRAEFNTLLDRLEKDIHEELNEFHAAEVNLTQEHQLICEKSVEILEKVVDNVTEVRKTEEPLAAFATFTKATKKAKEYKRVLKDVKRDARTVEIKLQPARELIESMKRLICLGNLQTLIVPKTYHLKLKRLRKPNMRVVETLVHSVRMPGDDEKHDCEVTGSTFLQDGSLVICDKHNNKVKLLDRHLACKYDLKLDGAPWDVAEVNANWIVTTLPFTKKLVFLNADGNEGLRKGRTIQTERMCWGVAICAEDIIISVHDNPGHGKIHILDKRGHTKKIIGAEAEQTTYLFELPSYLAVSHDGERIYVADGDAKRTITCILKKNGNIVYDYNVSQFGYAKSTNVTEMHNPWSFKIIVDEDDYVFANLGDKDMIQVITDKGVKGKTILRNTEKLFGPHTMSYREIDATLIIGLWDQVQSFRFKEIEVKT
ncbi:uncharacterized protein LOC128228835 [Mya arenaria]|uniref:uncharacterized protein LOC128228835 n=1 Tax=Mya arenaria TaxID=6604 RepID=UPI0022E0504F|nr:uncharacterized protein LOC128228835 [Mya arenaria]